MTRHKFAVFSDTVFRYFIIFLISMAWLRFYYGNFYATLFLSIASTIFINLFISFILSKSNERKKSSIDKIKKIDVCATELKLMTSKEKYDFFTTVITKNKITSRAKNHIIFELNQKKYLLKYYNEIDDNVVYEVVSEAATGVQKIILICEKNNTAMHKSIIKFDGIDCHILDKTLAYNTLYEKKQIFPKSSIKEIPKEKMSAKDFFNIIFEKRKYKRYFFCGLILLFANIVIPYNVYYIIVGTLLLVFSLVCLFQPLWNRGVIKTIWN